MTFRIGTEDSLGYWTVTLKIQQALKKDGVYVWVTVNSLVKNKMVDFFICWTVFTVIITNNLQKVPHDLSRHGSES